MLSTVNVKIFMLWNFRASMLVFSRDQMVVQIAIEFSLRSHHDFMYLYLKSLQEMPENMCVSSITAIPICRVNYKITTRFSFCDLLTTAISFFHKS